MKTKTESKSLVQFNKEIRAKIPSLALLGIEFTEYTPDRVRASVLFAPNKNHINTAFGGSIYLAATTACYGLFLAMTAPFSKNKEYIILKKGSIEYLRPIDQDFEVVSSREPSLGVEKMLQSVLKMGHGKLELTSQVLQGSQVCATFKGVFVLRTK